MNMFTMFSLFKNTVDVFKSVLKQVPSNWNELSQELPTHVQNALWLWQTNAFWMPLDKSYRVLENGHSFMQFS